MHDFLTQFEQYCKNPDVDSNKARAYAKAIEYLCDYLQISEIDSQAVDKIRTIEEDVSDKNSAFYKELLTFLTERRQKSYLEGGFVRAALKPFFCFVNERRVTTREFKWVKFYTELADKLLTYKNDRASLVEIIKSLFNKTNLKLPTLEKDNKIIDVDPFTFFALFNKEIKVSNRILLLNVIKDMLGISAVVPDEFDGIPTVMPLKATFYYFAGDRNDNDINNLWELFEVALKYADNNTEGRNRFIELFDAVSKQKGISWNITMGLYWIRPYSYINLDARNRKLLENNHERFGDRLDLLKLLKTVPSGNEYLNIILATKDVMTEYATFPELSYDAWKQSNEDKAKFYGEEILNTNLHHDEKSDDMFEIKFDKNIILYGPPGTGKTYNTAIYAVAIIENKSLEEVSSEDYFDILERYNDYKKQGKIEFTTFHQSYGYEEFIEGIKPIMSDDSDVSYDVVPGVFKAFCERALTCTDISSEQQFDIAWEKLIEAAIANGNKYTFTRRSGSTINAELYNQEKLRLSWNGNSNSYNDFTKVAVYKQWVEEKGIEEVSSSGGKWLYTIREAIIDELKQNFDLGTTQKNTTNYVFIIDEINRGNISKILGELITLIESTKRIGQDEEMQAKLPYSQKDFGVPDNVYIIGTMNTADRSIAAIDTALRRRFSFKEMMPQANVLDGVEVDGVSISNMIEKMNRRIEVLYDREHTIGHAYFIPLTKNDSIEILAEIFKNKILPLLQEYFYEDYDKIRRVIGDNQKTNTELPEFIIKDKVNEIELFGEDTDIIEEAYKYSINESAFANIEAYKKMI